MTWLRKNNLNQRPTAAQPLLTQSEDRELDLAVQRLIHVENTIRKLTKETKRYLDATRFLDQADQRLSTNLSGCGLTHISDEFRRVVEDYLTITIEMGKTVQEMVVLLQKTFIEPLKKLLEEFVLIEAELTKREELVSVWSSSHNRVKKLQEKKDKSASHIAKLEREKRAEESAGKELRTMHKRLLTELPWFLDKRLEYIKPSVHALIMIQLDYYGNATKLFTKLMPQNDPSASSSSAMMSEEDFQSLVNGQLHRIKSLAIVADQ